jgi:hypothetical protein
MKIGDSYVSDHNTEQLIKEWRQAFRDGKLADWQIKRIEAIPGWTREEQEP